jgi:hypothetical protein
LIQLLAGACGLLALLLKDRGLLPAIALAVVAAPTLGA